MNRANRLRIFIDVQLSEAAWKVLREGAPDCEWCVPRNPAASVLAKAPPDELLLEADIAFGQPDPDMILQSERIRWVHVASSGITRYDTPQFWAALRRKGVVFTHSPSVYAEPCAQHVLAFMLAQARELPAALGARPAVGAAQWHDLRGACRLLRDQQVLILGFGAIGRRLAELLQPFGLRILGYRRRSRGDEPVPIVAEADLESALGRSDHVVNILPDNPQTRGFFDARRFSAVRTGAVFYNIGRGTTVDQAALYEALRSGRLRAAWLDVTDPEPLPDDHPLRTLPNCYITPHIAGGFSEEFTALARHFLDNLARFRSGEPMRDRVV